MSFMSYSAAMKKRLYRNTEEAMLAGVCAGLADYVGLDQAIWRLAAVFLTIVTAGSFLFVYLIAWIIIPPAPQGGERVRDVEYTVRDE
jgi:phage shock protein PspC (stress-responsive transcriptional regulator)